jgi:hypothetical protein
MVGGEGGGGGGGGGDPIKAADAWGACGASRLMDHLENGS